ncbi:hypothetical protein NIES4071_88760 [Calothrix sp. NIES-4071]|nr:hypothetical protein NIES4071_88760 [Calothrix sp. NIES-4071]BAZ63143.1 hypothetical protein NIES4105_88690 [Calothrix sp. NIES-4105]
MLIINILQCKIITCEDKSHARLAEIDENLICNELSPLERSQLCRERDKILERMGLRAQSGDNQYTKKGLNYFHPLLKRQRK